MSHPFFKVTNDGTKRRQGAIINAIRALKPGETVLLPTSAGSVLSTVGNLRARGEVQPGEFSVKREGPRAARIWRLRPG